MRKTLFAITAGALLLALSAQGAQARTVSGTELKKLRGVYTAIWKGRKARVKLNADGTLHAVSGTKKDVGRWRVRGNVLCVAFRVWTRGKYKCGTVEKKGAWYVGLRKKNGVPRLKFRR